MAEPILVTPGQLVAQPEWEALVRQHGGDRPATIRPPTKLEQQQIEDAGGDLTQNPIYRAYMTDGSYVEYRAAPNGTDYQIVDYHPSPKFTQAQPTAAASQNKAPGGKAFEDDPPETRDTGRRWGWNPETQLFDRNLGPTQVAQEIARNAGLPADKDPRAETDAERAARAKETQAAQERAQTRNAGAGTKIRETTAIVNGKKVTTETWRRPDGREEEVTAEAPASSAERPGVVEEPYQHDDGKTYTRVTRTDPATNSKTTVYLDPVTRAEVTPPPKGVGNPAGLPSYRPDLTRPGAGLIDYAKQLDEYMAAHPDFTWEKRQLVLQQAQVQAKQVADEFNVGATILREQFQSNISQRGQDITQAGNRATLATQHHQNAVALIEKFGPYLGVEPGAAGKLFMGMMASQLATATAYGGMQNTPREELDPRLTAYANRAVGGFGGPGAAAAPAPPAAVPAAAPGQADAAMAEAVRQQQAAAPVFRPQPPVDLAPAAGAPPTAGETGGPPLAPGPVLGPSPYNGPAESPAHASIPPAVPPTQSMAGVPPAPAPQAPVDLPPVGAPSVYGGAGDEVPPGLQGLLPPPEAPSWRAQAQAQADALGAPPAAPGQVALGYQALGALPPVALASRIPGLLPEHDEQARRELAAAGWGG